MSLLLGTLIQKSAQIGGALVQDRITTPAQQQEVQLRALLRKARFTAFGQQYGFKQLIGAHDLHRAFRNAVPAADYNSLYNNWWSKAHLCDTPDVCWPGVVPYYALSSGTSQAATKYIPVTEHQLHFTRRGARRMFYDLPHFGLSANQYTKQMLMVGSCTEPRLEGLHMTGDLSGIVGRNRPLWMERYYRPGREISQLPEWSQRIDRIAAEAPHWDIGFAVSNPMWLQMIFERIIDQHKLAHIHEIWPNFSVYVHGGVFFDPYKASFERLLGQEVCYLNSYMASEGLFAWTRHPKDSGMQLVTDGGIFYEFVPFDEKNFDDNGDLRSDSPVSLTLNEVEPNKDYALLLSTCAGAWRYLLGDTVRFTDTQHAQIKISGRTKQFISVCGEHLSIDNLNDAVRRADLALNAGIREFTVSGVKEGSFWAHQWYISCDNPNVQPDALREAIDKALCDLNEDYAIERIYALKNVHLNILPNATFMNWLQSKGKFNGQAKIPRVMKGRQLDDFLDFLK
jgi:GH3 auxin-responsive promoter